MTGEEATRILDSIPGAWEDLQAGRRDAAAGRVTPLDEAFRADADLESDRSWPGSSSVEAAYDKLLGSIGRRAADINMPLTSHWPLFGAHYDHGPLIVGQSLFGWVNEWSPEAAQTDAGRAAVLAESKLAMHEREDPMDWLETSDVRGSPWWSACPLLVETLAPGPAPWYSRFGWANLFPVAPATFKSNPYGALKEAQDRTSAASSTPSSRPRSRRS